MTGQDDPIAAFNQVLSEVLDDLQVAAQADRKVQWSHSLHGEVDRLVRDLRTWAARLMDQDDALGVSALTFMPSRAGRKQRNPWPRTPSDEQVRDVLDGMLARLGDHARAARAEQTDERTRAALDEVEQGLQAHREALRQG